MTKNNFISSEQNVNYFKTEKTWDRIFVAIRRRLGNLKKIAPIFDPLRSHGSDV